MQDDDTDGTTETNKRFYALAADAMCGCLPLRQWQDQSSRTRAVFGDLGGTGMFVGGIKTQAHLSFKRFIRECASRPAHLYDGRVWHVLFVSWVK